LTSSDFIGECVDDTASDEASGAAVLEESEKIFALFGVEILAEHVEILRNLFVKKLNRRIKFTFGIISKCRRRM
jgi:hypothetical protein